MPLGLRVLRLAVPCQWIFPFLPHFHAAQINGYCALTISALFSVQSGKISKTRQQNFSYKVTALPTPSAHFPSSYTRGNSSFIFIGQLFSNIKGIIKSYLGYIKI